MSSSSSSTSATITTSSSDDRQVIFKVKDTSAAISAMLHTDNGSEDIIGAAAAAAELTAGMEDVGFAVAPRTDCPHCVGVVSHFSAIGQQQQQENNQNDINDGNNYINNNHSGDNDNGSGNGGLQERLENLFEKQHSGHQCQSCDEKFENWLCLTCLTTACSQYKSGHMADHHRQSGHPVVLSLVDLSLWCYECDAYVEHESLRDVVASVHRFKFGQYPAGYEEDVILQQQQQQQHQSQQQEKDEDEHVVHVEQQQQQQEQELEKESLTKHDGNEEQNDNGEEEEEEESSLEATLAALSLKESEIKDQTMSHVITAVAEKIRHANKIVVLTGAGLSTESQIPDFRTPGTGLYYNLQRFNLPFPTAVFDLGFFKQNPVPFYQLAKGMIGKEDEFLPNAGHYFISLLHEKGKLLRNFTQNIDGLEFKTSLPHDKIVQAHGTFETATCTNRRCVAKYDISWIKQSLFAEDVVDSDDDKSSCVPRCEKCNAVVKSDIIFFGESLPSRFHSAMKSDVPEADLLIVMGTSLTVYPVAMIPSLVDAEKCSARVLINREAGGPFRDPYSDDNSSSSSSDSDSDDVIVYHGTRHKPAASQFEDYFLKGSIGECVKMLCEELGWTDELNALVAS